MAEVCSSDVSFTTEFQLVSNGRRQETGATVAALVVWFDVTFPHTTASNDPIAIDTSPERPATHWAQTVLALKHSVPRDATGDISFASDPISRVLSISVHYSNPSQTLFYTMDVSH